MEHVQFATEDLDHELARRQRFPPASVRLAPNKFREEWVSRETLRAELADMPANHPERTWREWELALAERQADHFPNRLFYRVVIR